MPKKKIRSHGVVPANWRWRDGRPRWEPSPSLRRGGWKGGDFKSERGEWLSQGASIDAAKALNAAVGAWRKGELVAPEFKRFAPDGATQQARKPASPEDRFAIGALVDAFTGTKDGKVKASEEFAALAASTQRDYRNKLKRLVDVLAGYIELPDPRTATAGALAAYEAAVAERRADPIFALEPAETDDGLLDPLYEAYHALKARSGVHQASGVMAVARLWLEWCHRRQSRRIRNWAADVERETPQGRIRPLSAEEIAALVKAAEALGVPSIADSVLLGVDLSWSQGDRLALTWDRVREGVCHTGLKGRQKTGNVGATPLLSLGLRRIGVITARQDAMAAHPTHVIWCERTGAPWKADHYRHAFAEVRALAAKECPSVADARDQDLRDTAVTWALNAGLQPPQIASRTLQKLSSVVDLITRHYGEIGPEIAAQGRERLDAYLAAKGVAL